MKNQSRSTQAVQKMPLYQKADNKAYKVFLTILSFLVLYVVSMVFAMRNSDPEVAVGFGISQIPMYAAWLVLLIGRIRYLCVHKRRPAPIKAVKAFLMWWWRFIALYRAKFHAAPDDANWIEKQIGAFNRNSSAFYSGGELGDDVTQYYRNLFRLHRKRLDSMGLRLETKRSRMVLENCRPVRTTVTNDGKLRSIHAEEHIIGSNAIYKGSRRLYSRRLKGCMHYDIVGAVGGNSTFKCPQCGNISAIKDFIDGCPYCGTKVMMENLGDRIADCHFYRDPEAELKKSRIRISEWANRLVLALTILEFAAMVHSFGGTAMASPGDHLPFIVVLAVMTMIVIFALLFATTHITFAPFKLLVRVLYTKLRKRYSKDMQLARRNAVKLSYIHRFNGDFSLHAFFGNVQNKLAAIHYAENMKQVGVYTAVDLSVYIQRYANVAECSFESMELTNYRSTGDRETVKVEAKLRLMNYKDGKLAACPEKAELTLERYSGSELKTRYGTHIPVCGKCGAPVDLLNGNICVWCGTCLEARKIDWCITAYRSES